MPYPIADAHTDYLHVLCEGRAKLDACIASQVHVSREALLKGHVKLQCFAAFVDAKKTGNPTIACLEQIDAFYRMLDAWGDDIVVVTAENIDTVRKSAAIGAVLTLEGGEPIGESLGALRVFRRLGVRAIAITWNNKNAIGTPAIVDETTGLTRFGVACIEEMNRLSIAVDVSHLNVAGFKDVLAASSQPVMASHSNARAVCDHFRNLYDWQIDDIIRTNGYIGLNFCSGFLRKTEKGAPEASDLGDLVAHAKHILARGGERVLGLGSDFDGITSCSEELKGAQDFQLIAHRFEQEGFPKTLIEDICYGNLARFLRQFL